MSKDPSQLDAQTVQTCPAEVDMVSQESHEEDDGGDHDNDSEDLAVLADSDLDMDDYLLHCAQVGVPSCE